MTCLRFSRFRLVVVLAAALQLAVAGFAFAQKAPPDSGAAAKHGCEWHGWFQPVPWSSISAPRKLSPGESVKVEFGAACAGVGVKDALADENSWIMFDKEGRRKVEGDGFTIGRTSDRSFILTVGKNAVPGSRSVYSMDFVLDKVFITPMQFGIAGSATATNGADTGGDTAGFCCRQQGSPCVALKVGASDAPSRCGDGNPWVPVAKQGGLEASKTLCDYVCAAPFACLQKSGDCVIASPDECRQAGGGLFVGDVEECRSYAATANMPDKFYFSPSAAGSQTASKGIQKPGKPDGAGGTCMQVKPLDDGTYPHPVPPAYDTYTKSAADCADASKYYCVTMPVGGALQRGCTSMPIQIPAGTGQLCSDYDATGNPEDPLKVNIDGATLLYPPFCGPQLGGGGNAAYSRYKPKPGSGAGPDGGFSTAAECRLACPPCKNKDCFDADRPGSLMPLQTANELKPCEPKECGPEPRMPERLCNDGINFSGPTGTCVRNNGKCGWEIKECPVSPLLCTPDDCGPEPLIRDRPCPDGSPRKRQCVPKNDNCVWQLPECKPGASPSPPALAVCKVQPAQSGACGDPFKADGLGFCLGTTDMLVRQCGGDNEGRYQTFRCPDGCGGGACTREQVKICDGQGFFCSKIVDENGRCMANNLTCEGNEQKVCSRSDEGSPKQRSCGVKSCEGTCCRCVPDTSP